MKVAHMADFSHESCAFVQERGEGARGEGGSWEAAVRRAPARTLLELRPWRRAGASDLLESPEEALRSCTRAGPIEASINGEAAVALGERAGDGSGASGIFSAPGSPPART